MLAKDAGRIERRIQPRLSSGDNGLPDGRSWEWVRDPRDGASRGVDGSDAGDR
jgi:hypothetical protein